jgi:hypothetical protein
MTAPLLRCRYKPAWGVGLTVIGAVVLALTLTAAILIPGRSLLGAFPSLVCLVAGVGYLRRPYFEITEAEVRAPALFGPVVTRYPRQDAPLRLEGKRLYVGEKKTGLVASMAHTDDWSRLRAHTRAEVFD